MENTKDLQYKSPEGIEVDKGEHVREAASSLESAARHGFCLRLASCMKAAI
jgi:hypothetical protein